MIDDRWLIDWLIDCLIDDTDDDCDKLQGEYEELEERGHYDQYHNWLRQLEQRQAASRHPGC